MSNELPSDEQLRFWIETRLRDALLDDEKVLLAAAVLKVGMVEHSHQGLIEAVRTMLASFIVGALGVEID